MVHKHSGLRAMAGFVGRVLGRTAGAVLGLALTLFGLALGVMVPLLPLGILVGLLGVLVIILALSSIPPDGATKKL